jgi:hypothetical protein
MRAFAGRVVASAVFAAWCAAVLAEEPKKPVIRDELEALEARLDRAVDSVSLPHAARLVGRGETARAYRLPGYGIVLVLTPRALPGASGRVYFVQRGSGPKVLKYRVETNTGAATRVEVDVEDEEGVETFERQVLVLQHETEAARRAAEEEMERIVHDVRVRIAPPPPPVAEPAPPAPAPPAPAPPGSPVAAEAGDPPAPGEPGRGPIAWTAMAPKAPAPPPWKFWFEGGAMETRAPEAVIADVRASLVETLTAPAEALTGLPVDERVTVAVDFVPGGMFAANQRPGRTLVVSVRARDVAARARGSISLEELRRRVEISEY